jgi:2-hydroxychromene-2-carboxylate isomerase
MSDSDFTFANTGSFSTMPKTTIEFFWDPASPFTYLAATQIEALAADCNAELIWKPFLLGKVFEATGNRPPVSVPAKGKHLFQDLRRWATFYGVPLQFPKSFPVNSVTPERAAIAAANAGKGPEFARAVMTAHWGDGRDISLPDELKAIATSVGLDGDAILAATQDAAVKETLKGNTEDAIRRGVFGAPTFFVGDEMFWGNDRLELLRAHLKGRLAA